MDGNRRWAMKHAVKSILGHHNGKENLKKIMDLCPRKGIKILTVYALSTENLTKRSPKEAKGLLKLIEETIRDDYGEFMRKRYQVKILGNKDGLPKSIIERFDEIEKENNIKNPTMLLQACINYGGQDEIVRSVKKLLNKGLELSVKNIEDNLDSKLVPDLIIRTGGDQRLSNFLLWQAAYSDFYFVDTLWPDFGEVELDKALAHLKKVNKNFGK